MAVRRESAGRALRRPARLRHGAAALVLLLAGGVAAAPPPSSAVYPRQPATGHGLTCLAGSGVRCFASDSMERRWEALPGTRTFELVMAPDAILAGSTAGLHALDPTDGSVRWRWRSGAEVFSPAVESSFAYASDRAGRVAAIRLTDGEIRWQRRLDGWLYTPALVAGQLITGGRGAIVYALDQDTGETVWTRKLAQELVYRPVAVGNGVVVTAFDGSVIRLGRDGSIRWRDRDPSPSFSPAVAGNLLLFGGMDGILRARDARTGRMRWRVELSGRLNIPAREDGGEAAVVSPDGTFALVDAVDGSVQVRTSIPGSPVGAPIRTGDGTWRVFQRHRGIISWVVASEP